MTTPVSDTRVSFAQQLVSDTRVSFWRAIGAKLLVTAVLPASKLLRVSDPRYDPRNGFGVES